MKLQCSDIPEQGLRFDIRGEDGRWEGRVVIGYDDQGLPKTKNVLAKTDPVSVTPL